MKQNVYLISFYVGVLVGASLPSWGVSLSWPHYVMSASSSHQSPSSQSYEAVGDDAQELRSIPITQPELSSTEQWSSDIVKGQNARRSSPSSQRQLGEEKGKGSTAPGTP